MPEQVHEFNIARFRIKIKLVLKKKRKKSFPWGNKADVPFEKVNARGGKQESAFSLTKGVRAFSLTNREGAFSLTREVLIRRKFC